MAEINKVKEVLFIVLITILFISLIFYAANIFFKVGMDDCYNSVKPVYNINGYSPNQTEMDNCYTLFNKTKEATEKNKLILISVATIVILLGVIFLEMDLFVNGIFYGSLLSSIIANIAYYNSSSIIALILGIIIFIELGFIIKKRIK